MGASIMDVPWLNLFQNGLSRDMQEKPDNLPINLMQTCHNCQVFVQAHLLSLISFKQRRTNHGTNITNLCRGV